MYEWLLHTEWLGNSALAWAIAAACALVGYAVLYGTAAIIGGYLRRLAERRQGPGLRIAADVVKATRGWLLLLITIAIAFSFLKFETTTGTWLHLATYALIGIQIALWVSTLLVSWIKRATARADGKPSTNAIIVGILTWAVEFVVWVTLILALLAQGGVNITAFVASLGVGGVAIALALQTVLGDLFASISIGLDKPFVVGDFIGFGSELGTVTKVGVKSTRIQSLSGEELAVTNSVLLQNLVHNYSRRQERRIVFTFRLPFDTPREKLPTVVERVRGFIDVEQQARFDRGYLSGFGDSGLEFEFVYYVLDPTYNLFVDIQQRINLQMLDAWDELGIKFSIPARRIHAASADAVPMLVAGADQID